MDKDKLKRAMQYAVQNPKSEFSIELNSRVQRGEYNDILKSEGVDTKSFEPPKKKGFFRSLGEGLIKSEKEFGKSIAGAIDVFTGLGGGKDFEIAQSQDMQTTMQIIKRIREKKAKGEDASRFERLLDNMKGGPEKNDLLERLAEQTPRTVGGQALGVAVDVIGGGTLGTKAASVIKSPTTLLKGAAKGAATGAAAGGGFGAAQGLARGLQEGREGSDLTSEIIASGIIGGGLGGVLGGVTGGISGLIRGKVIRRAQLFDELNNNPEIVAKYSLDDTGRIAKDKNVQEVLKQGIPEKYVAVVKNAGSQDKSKFKEMFRLAEKASKDARAVDRPSDIVGRSIVDRTKHLVSQLQIAGKQVDEAANSLRGQTASPKVAVQTFIDDLADDLDVVFRKGKPVFKDSSIEGIKPAEDLIKKVLKRSKNVGDDAFKIHKLKKFIDEQVTFGKVGEGLSGKTERIVKSFRANLDEVLDTNFQSYDVPNKAFARAIRLLDDTKSVLGKKFNPNNGTIRAGAVARRILGNSANRGDILEYVKTLEAFFNETGGKGGDDILSQVVFADILEDVFGTQATTGLRGQFERGVTDIGLAAQDVFQGQKVSGGIKFVLSGIKRVRGITDEAKVEALARLIGLR